VVVVSSVESSFSP